MEFRVSRFLSRFGCMQSKPRLIISNHELRHESAAAGCFQTNDRRLYHRSSFQSNTCLRSVCLSPALSFCVSRPPTFQPLQTRGIVIGRVIDWFRTSELTSIEGISKSLLSSTPVKTVENFYEWAAVATGLPWWLNFFVCSLALQLAFNAPATIYMGRWMTSKEKHMGDMIALKGALMRSPSRENIAMFGRTDKELQREYGCQKYKLFLTIAYQIAYVTITSFGVRAVLMNSSSGAASAMLPWGSLLSSADSMFILPVVNVALSLLVVEVGAWKKLGSHAGLKMTLKRASLPFKPEPQYILNVRRFCCLPFIAIYCVVPSALTIHWFVMIMTSVNLQILLAHKSTRRTMGIAPGYYETDKPYQDFYEYLRKDLTLFHKKQ